MAHPLQQQDRPQLRSDGSLPRFELVDDFAELMRPPECEDRAGTADPARPSRAPNGALELVDACARRLIAFDYQQMTFLSWLTTRADRSVADLLLTVLTLAARHLGDLWLEDICSFNDVTIGMHRLTLLLIALEPPSGDPLAVDQHGGRIFLAPAPDDQHGFGLGIVGFFLRRAGWDVSADLESDSGHIVGRLSQREFTVAGFSVGHERAIEPVTTLIHDARRRSRNRDIKLIVGGPMIVGNPDLAEAMGADLWATDAASLVSRLVPLIPA